LVKKKIFGKNILLKKFGYKIKFVLKKNLVKKKIFGKKKKFW
jgi:hypothetical protein